MKRLGIIGFFVVSVLFVLGIQASTCVPLNVNYLTTTSSDLSPMWTDNAQVWDFNTDYHYANGTAYNKNLGLVEANLFTPALDLSGSESVTMQFSHVHNYCGTPSEELTLWVTADFKETYDASSWEQLTIDPYAANNAWKPWVDVSIDVPVEFVGANTVFAFHYKNTETKNGTWEIDKVKIVCAVNAR